MDRKRISSALPLLLLLGAVLAGPAAGQCILANPSFELGGSGGDVFGGWNQFGVLGSTGDAYHGSVAARVIGPDYGGWDMSAFWQSMDCAEDEQWWVTGHVRVDADNPLTGGSYALVNVEWHDAGDNMLDFDSITVATAASPTDEWIDFSVVSAPAPAGTVKTHVLFGVLQSPTAPPPDVHYDQVTFDSTTPPTIDDLQWNDFPSGVSVDFAGRTWRVKGPGVYGPGNNAFCTNADCAWVDGEDRLHLALRDRGAIWTSSEVALEEALGYGDYVLTTVGRLDQIDIQAVLGIFLWEYGPCWDEGYLWWNPYNEIDVEYSRWGFYANDIGQCVAQPYDYPGNISRFDAVFGAEEVASHAMRWLPDRVEWRVWRGGPGDEAPETMIHAWTYAGPHIPRPEQPRMHLNLWKLGGDPSSDQEVVFQDFTFVPEDPGTHAEGLPALPAGRLHPAAPNPFNPRTTLRFELTRGGDVRLDVYDLDGRRVRTLVDGYLPAGEHRAIWAGRDDGGRPLSSGPYLGQPG
ncbi:hypothetical protein H8E07_09250, partial [bacterium]|nr:hypothetical protein [bacterium]